MECQYAVRLRNIALVSISRELRVLAKRRETSSQAIPKGQNIALLKRQTDDARKALHDHVLDCRQCRGSLAGQELASAQHASD